MTMSSTPLCKTSPHSEYKPADPISEVSVEPPLPGQENVLSQTQSLSDPPPSQTYHGLTSGHLAALKGLIPLNVDLPRILLNAGIFSYLTFTVKMLWKLSMMCRSRPLAVGLLVPSVATYAFVRRYSTGKFNGTQKHAGIAQAAVDVTIFAGTFICTSVVWSLISLTGDLGAMVFLVYSFGAQYLMTSA
ncbi:hypothetical protein F5878DRAFT_661349 [Lentinula raphanica]|uniref:Uncharacterized protein n=1 Tax=Lentinula raphanica TaxID=153919 RepID=A0AA38P8I2_9AGAR|nr:hypothetical protein F5878DRAFT_661349 [Lentinula raphanica]